jgi:DmsE family decaheme c-type cytochrome
MKKNNVWSGPVFLLLVFAFLLMLLPLALEAATYVGADTCKGCHEDRYNSYLKTYHSTKTDSKTPAAKQECESCHGAGSDHVDAGGGRGVGGIIPLGLKTSTPKKINETCLTCHSQAKMFWKTGVHANRNLACTNCHTLHPEEKAKVNKSLLKMPSETETCFMCHKDKKAIMQRSSHMPVREGKLTCATCHDPHGTGAARNLKAATPNQLCYKCHTEKRGPFLWEHAPVRESCLNCHDAHGSQHDKMLVAKRPFLICQRCHIATRHPSTLYDTSGIATQNNRLINRSCLNCHSMIHGSNHPSGKTFLR